MDLQSEEPLRTQPSAITKAYKTVAQRYQSLLDASTPHVTGRWVAAVLMLVVYMGRVLYLQGWYIITYALGIYYLNLFIAFLTPKIDPAMNDDLDDGPSLPTTNSEEFRPFIRRLPEFKFWHSSMKATLIALFCTCFEAFNIPVFWPILLLYFFTLFCITMKRQIKHMIKYHYLPWTRGKTKYQGKEDTGKVVYTK
ncbi:protein RER1-like protein [Leptotrombidium deliense]|uniref:Protein RER1 n=1 Tax=Leptotrombidium deliense TaxID=299467 RepID=A0A443SE43_9ACAR|nr:protein RER1-like protein [Leptotrombidium deliense]